MVSNHLTWRDMQDAAPEYFDTEVKPEGYPESVPAPGRWRVTRGRAGEPGDDFRCAATFVLGNAKAGGLVLVHGSVAFGEGGGRHAHAWVDLPNDLTYDGATQAFYPTGAWRAAANPEVDATYTAEEAARHVLSTGHHGPWTGPDPTQAP